MAVSLITGACRGRELEDTSASRPPAPTSSAEPERLGLTSSGDGEEASPTSNAEPEATPEEGSAVLPPLDSSAEHIRALSGDGSDEVGLRVALTPASPDVDHRAASEQALEAGDLPRALEALRQHLHRAPPSAEDLVRVGRWARELAQLELSVLALEEAVRLFPDSVEGHLQLARTHLEGDTLQDARRAARKAVRLAPEEAVGFDLLGRIEMARSRWEPAYLAFDRALALDPSNPHVLNHKGLLLIFMKRGAEAVDTLLASIECFGERVPHYVLNNLGLAFELDGQLGRAREAFQEALDVSPFYARAEINLRRVDRAQKESEALTKGEGTPSPLAARTSGDDSASQSRDEGTGLPEPTR